MLYLLFSFYSPNSFIFGWFFFVREETWIVARFTMEYPPRIQLRFLFFYFSVLEIGPWTNPINDRFMFRLTMIHVEIITPCAVEITQYALKRAEAPSPGRRPGWLWTPTCRPERAKALKNPAINNSFALTGRLVACYYTQGDALGCGLLGFQPVSTVHFGYFLLFLFTKLALGQILLMTD